ncbi:PemK-like protein [Candidatus Desulfarcum epimagneticum]|uniref:PemK-like protein n=1 Tax=uncultured Desulfobacteraceae bacterium TaxID=218296 RepID=A0A484HFZ3_9BACT|nr:PemK-like protein [uncultured Desulfobacteraceae bacterium]
MKSTTHYKKWDIVLVPFPFTDLSASKKRPALIISPDEYNSGPDVVIAFITSKMNVKPRLGDFRIREWKKAKLPKPSLIRMKFATIDQNIIAKQFGRLSGEDIRLFKKKISDFFSN